MQTFIIGIDPDVEKCGFAVKEKGAKQIHDVKAFPFFDCLNEINKYKESGNVVVYVDAGWLISKSNWHESQGKQRGEKIAKNVGACHQVGKLIVEYCRRKGIEVHEVRPVGRKISADWLKKLGVWPGKTNQDTRDAICLILSK